MTIRQKNATYSPTLTLTISGAKSLVIPCSNQNVGADAPLNSLYSSPCCPDQYSCCSFAFFKLHDKGKQRNFTWTPALAGGSDVCRHCDLCRGKGDTRNRDTKARDCPARLFLLASLSNSYRSSNNNQIKRVCHIMV